MAGTVAVTDILKCQIKADQEDPCF